EELRKRIQEQDYLGALKIVDDLEEMSLEDKLNKIYSYAVILLIHLIKQAAENRSTRSWERSILNSVDNINKTNKRRKAGGYYAQKDVLIEIIHEAYPRALREAADEAFEGKYDVERLEDFFDIEQVKKQAISLLEP
ncbi:MAG: DUF29 family protein, partial [Cyanobacteria bacterium J06558_2]